MYKRQALLVDATNLRTWRGRLRGYLTEMEEEVFRKADVVWAPSRAVVEAIRGIGAEVEDSGRRPVVVSSNPFTGGDAGVGLAEPRPTAQPASPCDQQTAPAEREEIVFVGRLERRKGLELLVANDISAADAGFEVDSNRVTLITAHGEESLPLLSKSAVAEAIMARAATMMSGDG